MVCLILPTQQVAGLALTSVLCPRDCMVNTVGLLPLIWKQEPWKESENTADTGGSIPAWLRLEMVKRHPALGVTLLGWLGYHLGHYVALPGERGPLGLRRVGMGVSTVWWSFPLWSVQPSPQRWLLESRASVAHAEIP